MIKKKITLGVLISVLAGCATTHTIKNASGKKIYDIDCTGKLVKMSVCYDKAKSLCPQGYKVIPRKNEQYNPYPLNSSMGIATAIGNSIPGVVKGLRVQCIG
jgi:hypothetical protein